ncbi:Uncharacterized protein BM_BM276 [Brugia malayi]|uniref:Bm276 n=1 Tax=Brugia malayi TaxID=6279 RepID=A0A0J9XNU8_BRUMA|nr:Uncharacterized protein BM_BM276 [Brugia malayi]CDP92421.1 Bm276 [Brugia malayi]VIO99894.1 Uncharacterized protein BM_BM276 [Brugia malayi]
MKSLLIEDRWNHGYHGLIKLIVVQRSFYQLIINK